MSLLTPAKNRFVREIEETLSATIKRLIHEALEAVDSRESIERICEQWDELLPEFRTLERECLLGREPGADELQRHKAISHQLILLAGLLAAAVERFHKICWNRPASERDLLRDRATLLGHQKDNFVFEFNGWHGPRLTEEQIEMAKKVLCVPV